VQKKPVEKILVEFGSSEFDDELSFDVVSFMNFEVIPLSEKLAWF
jgi:hypothetical protein